MGWFRKIFGAAHPPSGKWYGEQRHVSGGESAVAANARREKDPARQNGASPTGGGAQIYSRWDAAQDSRLNSAHWALAQDVTINQDLAVKLPVLRRRCAWEMKCNPMLAGVAETYTGDLVGPNGPDLQVQSSNKPYNEWLENHWREWWKMPDLAGILSGDEMIRLWVHQLFPSGEYFSQIVSDQSVETPIKMRLNNIAPRRIENPVSGSLDGQTELVMGIERNLFGKPLTYYVSEEQTQNAAVVTQVGAKPIPAAEMLHGFDPKEPGQARGVPLFAPALQPAADTRDYSDQVMDAARSAADTGVMLETTDTNVEADLTINESVDIERRTIRTNPPGWHGTQLRPEQPSTTYFEYLQERYRDYGRPFSMPLMMVLLDSKGVNYSGGRLDTQSYDRGLMVRRKVLERSLNRLIEILSQEAELVDRKAGKQVPERPDAVQIVWGWQPRPHVDPSRESKAIKELSADDLKVYTLADGLRLTSGRDLETHIAMLEKEKELLEAAGLISKPAEESSPGNGEPPAPAPAAGPASPADDSAPAGGLDSDEEDEDDG